MSPSPDSGGHALVIAAVLTALALVVLSAATATVALPALAAALHLERSAAVGVITAYQLGLVLALLPSGALGERYGYRRVYAAGLLVFTGASGLCAVATTLPALLALRALQGTGGAAVMALSVAILRAELTPGATGRVPPHPANAASVTGVTGASPAQSPGEATPGRLGRAIGWNAVTVALASAAGPAIGALVVAQLGWRWVFVLNVPLGGLAWALARHAPDGARRGAPLDARVLVPAAAAVVGAFSALRLLAEAPARAALVGAAALVAGAWSLRVQRGSAAPLIPVDLLRHLPLRRAVGASVACFAGQAAAQVVLPFYLQRAGLGGPAAGLLLTAWPLAVAVTAPVSARLTERWSAAALCTAGALTLAGGLLATAVLATASPAASAVPFTAAFTAAAILCGVGFGLFQVPNNRTMLLSAPAERSAAAGALQGTARLTGQTLGAVLVSLLLQNAGDAGLGAGLVAAALLTLLAAGISAGAPPANRAAPAPTYAASGGAKALPPCYDSSPNRAGRGAARAGSRRARACAEGR